ncbi:cyclic nucleotide-binding domain-containing protein [candidate division KSB1 bacterium]|nr:cyclic nucleotide-binding domain-containing protein [candidate division KSB1 bacterium]
MLTAIEKVIFLQNVDIFTEVPTEHLAYLAAISEEVRFLTKDDIYKENDAADSLYVVMDGKIKLHRDGDEITVAGPNEAFGTWALFDEKHRVATATAVEDSKLLRIDREDFYDILTDHVQIIEGIFKTLVTKLRGMLDRVSSGFPKKDVKE